MSQYMPDQMHSNTNGHHSDGASPNSSQMSMEGDNRRESATLISRTQKQHVTQNTITTTRTIREVKYLGPDGQPLDFMAGQNGPASLGYDPRMPDYQNHDFHNQQPGGQFQQPNYTNYGRPPTPPTPSERSSSPPPDSRHQDYMRGGGYPPRSGYEELDTTLMPPRPGIQQDLQFRNTPSPGMGGSSNHPGYAGPGYAPTSPEGGYPVASPPPVVGYPGSRPPTSRSSVSSLSQHPQPPDPRYHHPHDDDYNNYDQYVNSPNDPASAGDYVMANNSNNNGSHDNSIYGQNNNGAGLNPNNNNNYSNYDPRMGDNSVFDDGVDDSNGLGTDDHYQPEYHPLQQQQPHHPHKQQGYNYDQEPPVMAPRAVFDEDDAESRSMIGGGVGGPVHSPPPRHPASYAQPQPPGMSNAGVQWRDPNLTEVIEFLSNPNSVIKANAAAYLQHLCYMDDNMKADTRKMGGIPPLVSLLSHEMPEIHRNACGALRNLSYGRQNDDIKRAIKAAGGTNALVRLLRKTADNDVKELVTGVLWNLSSCDDLKRTIIDEALLVLVNIVIIPHSGWNARGGSHGGETHWSTVFRNASGILRNVSSAGDYGRRKLRECEGLVDSLLYLVRSAIERSNIDNKSVENAMCVLRNLSYRAQEVEDPNYDKKQVPPGESRASAKPNTDNLGCFGASNSSNSKGGSGGKHSSGGKGSSASGSSSQSRSGRPSTGMDLLWQPDVVQPYLNLLSNCSNPETLEAAAGAIQNLSACYWQASIDIRAAVRKEKGLPILVELLRMEVDRVVCAVATALRNLAIDPRNKELIGKYAMRDLVQKLPSGNHQRDVGTSDDTIAAVLATLNEVIKRHPEFSRSLLEAGGVDRLMNITRQRGKYTSRVVKFASQVLFSMWQHQELRDVYRKAGWKESDFVTKTVAARNARPNSPTHLNSTLNRPMASQGGTRYEDRTMGRGGGGGSGGGSGGAAASGHHYPHQGNGAPQPQQYLPENLPMENMSLYSGTGGGRMYPPAQNMVRPGEPVYAQVNRDTKKRSRTGAVGEHNIPMMENEDYQHHHHHWRVEDGSGQLLDHGGGAPPRDPTAGDSWV